MGKCLRLGSLILGISLVFGCASQNAGIVANGAHDPALAANSEALAEHDPVTGKLLVNKAKSAIGTPYVMGGSTPGGFDCSGLVQWTYNSLGVALPRTAREQATVGRKVEDVKDMRAGDIVAFRHPKRGYHTGIYVGDGKFVHSPRKRSRVRINSLSDPYFSSTLLGARRVDVADADNLMASASGNLEKMVEEKSRLALSARNIEKIKSVSRKQSAKSVASKKAVANAKSVASAKKKSTIASNARKIKSVSSVTGKSKGNVKNNAAHAKLAKASKNTSKLNAANDRKASARGTAVSAKKTRGKTVSMLSKKATQTTAKRRG